MLGFQVELGCGHNEPGCTGWANNQTVERVSFFGTVAQEHIVLFFLGKQHFVPLGYPRWEFRGGFLNLARGQQGGVCCPVSRCPVSVGERWDGNTECSERIMTT